MSKLEYAQDGIYQEAKGSLDSCADHLDQAIYYSQILVKDDFPHRDYIRNSLTNDVRKLKEELNNISEEIRKADNQVEHLTNEIVKGSGEIANIECKKRKRMIE